MQDFSHIPVKGGKEGALILFNEKPRAFGDMPENVLKMEGKYAQGRGL